MNRAEIQERLTPIFRDVFDDETLVLNDKMTADDVDEWDSLSHVRMIFTVEKAFGVKFAASEVTSMKNVGDLAALIEKKTSK
jgi:acyl carrier protein